MAENLMCELSVPGRIGFRFPDSDVPAAPLPEGMMRDDLPLPELAEIDVNIFTRRFGDNDLIIQQVVTNDSNRQMNLYSFIDLPDTNHLEQLISQLEPGATQKKNYRIRNARKWRGRYVRIGLYDPRGTRRINYRVKIE